LVNYNDVDEWAVNQNYDDFVAYAVDNPSAPTEEHLEDLLEDATTIINKNIGSFNTNITDSRFLEWVKKRHLRMVNRMRQIDLAGGKAQGFLGWSVTDFLQQRERDYLVTIGKILGYYKVGRVVT